MRKLCHTLHITHCVICTLSLSCRTDFHPKDGGSTFVLSFSIHLCIFMAVDPRRQHLTMLRAEIYVASFNVQMAYRCEIRFQSADGEISSLLACLHQWRTQEFCSGGVQQIQLRTEDRENAEGSGGGSPLVRGSGDSCNLVQEISFHTVKLS